MFAKFVASIALGLVVSGAALAGDIDLLLGRINDIGTRVAGAVGNIAERPKACPLSAQAFDALAKDADDVYTAVMETGPSPRAQKALFTIMVGVDAVRKDMAEKKCQ